MENNQIGGKIHSVEAVTLDLKTGKITKHKLEGEELTKWKVEHGFSTEVEDDTTDDRPESDT